ncbi:hypothetical protein F4680DRAFT_443101 [Xylaria scruposa]|nr:hypothetical protein F4680DRAFT_443101 [Xylaria scruposa]
MAFPEVARDPEKAQDDHHQEIPDDAVMSSEPHDTATDYTTYSTKGLYGIFEASVREHPDRGTEAEIRLNLSAMELIMDLVVAIALVVFMYHAYGLVAKEYGSAFTNVPTNTSLRQSSARPTVWPMSRRLNTKTLISIPSTPVAP